MIIIDKNKFHPVGTLTKSFGVKGKISAQLTSSFPEDPEEIDFIMLEKEGLLVPLQVIEMEFTSDETAIFQFEFVDAKEDTTAWIGCTLYLPNELINHSESDLSYETLTGYKLYNEENQYLGTITGFMDIPSNPLLAAEIQGDEYLFPAHEDLILEINEEEQMIRMKIMDGLFDLNTANDTTEQDD